ncbi:MAG: hypothetical protein JSS30_08075 [Verrucomicrobia bacterium]|nr:hypothetical protein [Verrucomicrobiota bacterium]
MIKKCILFLIAFYALAQFCQKQTDGFAVGKVSTLLLEGNGEETAIPSQSYHYLGKGGQAYVFISEDDQTVLKLFRSSRLNTLKFFCPFLKAKIDSLENNLKQTFQSYQIANTYLKNETGLIAVHFDHRPHQPLKIVDRLGIMHTLQDCPFVIQERAILVKEKIAQLMEAGEAEKAKESLANLRELVHHRIRLGIGDGDPNLIKNFGFCGDRPIQIDGGRFSLTPVSTGKFESSRQELKNWLNEHYPGVFDEAI